MSNEPLSCGGCDCVAYSVPEVLVHFEPLCRRSQLPVAILAQVWASRSCAPELTAVAMTDSDSVRQWRVRIQEDLQQVELLAETTGSCVRDLEAQVARLETRLNLYQRDLEAQVAWLKTRLARLERDLEAQVAQQ